MRPSRRAESKPAFVRSRSYGPFEFSESPYHLPIIIRPGGVVVSIASVRLR